MYLNGDHDDDEEDGDYASFTLIDKQLFKGKVNRKRCHNPRTCLKTEFARLNDICSEQILFKKRPLHIV